MRTVIAIVKIMLTLATVLFTNFDATIHIIFTLKENTTPYTDMDAANNTEIMCNMCVYCKSPLLRMNLRNLFFILISVAIGPAL